MNEYYSKFDRVLIVGNGKSGVAAENAVKSMGKDCIIAVNDQDALSMIDGATLVVVSPAVRPDSPLFSACEKLGTTVIGEVELGASLTAKPIIAVTGTNGKTTVTRLIEDMTGGTACGNIGYPITNAALENRTPPLVCEVSSFQLLTTRYFKPHIAVITNIQPDHLNYHETYEQYIAAKLLIARNMTSSDYLIVGNDVSVSALDGLKTAAQVYTTSVSTEVLGAYIRSDSFYFCGERVASIDSLRLRGEHNLKNALTAICAAKLAGVHNDAVKTALERAQCDCHRIELVCSTARVRYYDDSKSTNANSTLAAVKSMFGSTALIMGGSGKNLDYAPLFEELRKFDVRVVVITGECGDDLMRAARAAGVHYTRAANMEEAVEKATSAECDNVLLSPGAASFDCYRDYRERGDRFKAVARKLTGHYEV